MTYFGVPLDALGNLKTAPSATGASVDSFSRQRVSEPYGVFDAQQLCDNLPFLYENALTASGTATYMTNEASTRMRVTATGDKVIRQSKEYIPYQAGKSQLIAMSGVMGALTSGIRQRIGSFDADNGLFFEQDGTNLKVVRRTFVTGSAVDNAVNQSAWNLDRLNGAGSTVNPSGKTFDPTTTNIFVISYQWLGVGRALLGVDIDGQIIWCHQFLNANSLTKVYMSRPALPCRYEIENVSAGVVTSDLYAVCSSVSSEGGFDPRGVVVSQAMTSVRSVSTGSLINVRLKSGYNRGLITPLSFDIFTTTNSINYLAQVVIGGALGGSPSWANTTGSATEYDVAGTTVTGGLVIASLYGFSTASGGNRGAGELIPSAITAAANIAGTTDIVSVVINTLGGGAASFYAALTWKEIY